MGRSRPPSYPRKPHASGLARVKVRGQEIYLGPWGSPESWTAYRQLLTEYELQNASKWQSGTIAPPSGQRPPRTIRELAARYLEYCTTARAEDGELKSEVLNYKIVLRALCNTFGSIHPAEFRPALLRDFRGVLAQGTWIAEEERAARQRRGGRSARLKQSRRTTNRNVTRVKTLFAWAAEQWEGLLPEGRVSALREVKGLRPGEFGAVDEEDVPPANETYLAAALPLLSARVRAMAETLLLTGARIGELLRLKEGELERSERVRIARGVEIQTAGCWIYRPSRHKTAHHGARRIILFGPKAQAVVSPLLSGNPADYVFKSPRSTSSYEQSIARSCRRAFPHPELRPPKEGWHATREWLKTLSEADQQRWKAWAAEHHWHPHQLRHNAATRLVEQFGGELGWELARTILGHRSVDTTRRYALDALERAAQAQAKVG